MGKAQEITSRTDALKVIARDHVNNGLPLFRRAYNTREMVIGLIGLRGEGKSLTGSIVTLIDHMLRGKPCWSNMKIATGFEIEDDLARQYGLAKGGQVTFESEPLEREALFRLDSRYRKGCLFIDEINMQFAEARRAMANTNLESAAVIQQLRKLECSLVYTVIHEMWIDPRIRDGTDVFIKCEDTALNPEAIGQRRQLGVDIKWTVFYMSRLLKGWTYHQTHKTETGYVHAKPWWGIMDTLQLQDRSKYSVKMKGGLGFDTELSTDPQVIETRSKWGWLYEGIQALHDEGVDEIDASQLWEYLQLEQREANPKAVGQQMSDMGITKYQSTGGKYIYRIDTFELSKVPEARRELVLAH